MNLKTTFASKLHLIRWMANFCAFFLATAASPTASAQDKPDPGVGELKKAMTELREAIKDGNDTKVAELTCSQRDRHFVF